MSRQRKVRTVSASKPTMEGAGVRLRRAFGFGDTDETDPFLLLDDFRGEKPADYLAGFPWHPHRGIETITYILEGTVEHGDSMGNKGTIGAGDTQWMTAGSGIIHQEMPKGDAKGRMGGFQLWDNLPASRKMMDPRYRDVKSDQIPEVTTSAGVRIRVVCGEVDGQRGPVQDVVIDPEYLDVRLPPRTEYTHPTRFGHTVFAYVFDGEACFCDQGNAGRVGDANLVLFDDGDRLVVSTGERPVRFLLISGKPIREPVAWHGPIVMNTREELRVAFEEYDKGTFIKARS